MKTILLNLIKVIGLGTLVGYVWEIVYEELERLSKESEAAWDDKALEVVDKIVDTIIATHNGERVKSCRIIFEKFV